MKWVVLLLLGGAGVALIFSGLQLGAKHLQIARDGAFFEGTAVSLEEDRRGAEKRFYPVVEFRDRAGGARRFQDEHNVRKGTYELGTAVEVACAVGDASAAQIRTWRLEADPALLAGGGVLVTLLGLLAFGSLGDFPRLVLTAHGLLLLLFGSAAWIFVFWQPRDPANARWVLRAAPRRDPDVRQPALLV